MNLKVGLKMIKKMKVIGIQGVNASGKSTLSHRIAQNYLEADTVATDNLIAINRALNPHDSRIQYSSYSSWQRFGEPTEENIWKGFCEYRESNRRYMDCILSRARDQRVGMIIEGLHIEPKLFFSYSTDLDIDLFLLNVADEEIHKKRVVQKCSYRPELLKQLDTFFPHIRTLQGLLLDEAKEYPINVIETGIKMDDSLRQIKRMLK